MTGVRKEIGAMLLLLPLVGCSSFDGNFRTMHIAPDTLKVALEDELPTRPVPEHDYYWGMRNQNGFSISHVDPKEGARYNAFSVDLDGTLITRSKDQVLMQGPYGTVFAKSTYFYAAQYHHPPVDFHVELYFNEGIYERSQQAIPSDEPGELSAISVVRVFRAAPEFLVACATYGPDGHLSVLSVNGSRGGNWVHSNEVKALYKDLDVATMYVDFPKTRKYFGLPETFPVADYLKKMRNVSQPVGLSSYLDAINLHYRRNRYIRQDVFAGDGSRTTRYLRYVLTREDEELEPVDRLMKFGQ